VRSLRPLLVGATVSAALILLLGDFRGGLLTEFLVLGLLAASLDLVWGYGGMFSFGQSVPFGVSAFATAILLRDDPSLAIPALAIAVVIGVLVGAVMAALTVYRGLAGVTFALFTLVVALAGEQVALRWTDVTGGFNGLGGIPALAIGSTTLGDQAQNVTIGLIAVCAIWFTWWLTRTPYGRTLVAVRDNELRMAALGYDIRLFKASALAIAGGLGGLAGALYAPTTGFVHPGTIGLVMVTNVILWTLVGGRGSVIGPVLGAVALGTAGQVLSEVAQDWWVLATGLLLIVVVVFAPGGLWPLLEARFRGLRPPLPAPDVSIIKPVKPAEFTAPPIEAHHVSKRYGEFHALEDVDLGVEGPQMRCIVGPNGAGKTTLLDVLSGVIKPSAGSVRLLGKDFHRASPWALARAGVGRKFQTPQVIPEATVAENLSFASSDKRLRGSLVTQRTLQAELPAVGGRLLEATGLGERLDETAGYLSHGEKQWLEIAMVLSSGSRVVLLDEPTAGMTVSEVGFAAETLAEICRQEALAMVVIEHDMAFVRAAADQVTVLARGQVLADGSVSEIAGDRRVQDAYVGLETVGT
jgi:branched-chain amino acid transport system permease protein